jgi:hypothetical protein
MEFAGAPLNGFDLLRFAAEAWHVIVLEGEANCKEPPLRAGGSPSELRLHFATKPREEGEALQPRPALALF